MLGMHPSVATSQLLVAIIPSWRIHFPAIIKHNSISNQQIIPPASQTKQFLLENNYAFKFPPTKGCKQKSLIYPKLG